MSNSQRDQTVSPEAGALLSTLIEEVQQTRKFPKDAEVRARNDPWLIDDLLQHQLLRVGHRGSLVPTVDALRAVDTPLSQDLLGLTQRLFRTLRQLYVQNASQVRNAQELAHHIGADARSTSLALTLLLVSMPSIGKEAGMDMATGDIVGVLPTDGVLHRDPFAQDIQSQPLATGVPVMLLAQDFRGLSEVSWSPDGVCLVAGPNGAGKTTLLDIFAFLRDAFVHGVPQAVTQQRGASGMRRLDAAGPPEVMLGLNVGEVCWELRLPVEGGMVGSSPGEIVKAGGDILLRHGAHADTWYLGRERRPIDAEGRTCLRAAWEAQQSPSLIPLTDALRGFRIYGMYGLDALRNGGAGAEGDERLDPTGKNLFIVLRNWKAAPRRFSDSFAWVLRHAKRAFPGIIDDIEFDPPVGQVVPTRFYKPGASAALPMHRAPDGLLVGLLHLTAVASAREGTVIAIEEMENQLHPHAIRKLLAAMREIADERRLTILLTTHSPVLMNEFRDHPDQFYVMEPGREVLPVSLDKIHDPEWLAHFQLGDLYDRLEFGAPRAEGAEAPKTQGG